MVLVSLITIEAVTHIMVILLMMIEVDLVLILLGMAGSILVNGQITSATESV
jgi:hypothetical protein